MEQHEKYIRRCYELAEDAGKKGFFTFGALLVSDDKVIDEAENTTDYKKGIFGHAEFNLVHKLANHYSDIVFENAVFYTSCAPCVRCLMSIASLGVKTIVYGVSQKEFNRLLPFESDEVDYQGILNTMGASVKMIGPVLEEEGMRVYEYWGGSYCKLEQRLKDMEEMRAKNRED